MTCNSAVQSGILPASRLTFCATNTNIVYPAQGPTATRPRGPTSIAGLAVSYDNAAGFTGNGNIDAYTLLMANSIDTSKATEGYALVDRKTGTVVKYGQTTLGKRRCSQL